MSFLKIIALVIGPMLFWLGLGALIIISIGSFNSKTLYVTYLLLSVLVIIVGLLVTKYVAVTKNRTILYILFSLF